MVKSSNDWKVNLEIVPTTGKNRPVFPKHWKNRRENFRPLEEAGASNIGLKTNRFVLSVGTG